MDPRSEHRNALDLMNQGKYDEARTILTKLAAVKTGDYVPPPKSITFALAYCDYKVGAFAKVKAALKDISAGDAACLNLLAQAHYNLEEFQDATAIYEGMLRDGLYRDDVERTELVTNLTAAYSQSNHSRCHAVAAEEGMTTFDIAFNAATGMIHAKEYAKARELLANALALCLHEHGLDASSCDVLELARQAAQPDCPKNVSKVVSDAAPVLVQRAFVHFSLNEIDSASEILKLLLALRDKISVATYAAACVNWAAIKRDSDYFDTLTRLKEVQRPAVEAKLTSRQKLFIRYNASLLLLSTAVGAKPQRGADQCKRVVDQMCKEFPTADLTSMALTAWLVRHGVSTKTETHFRTFVSQRGTVDITSRLTLAQFAVMRGDIRAAVDRLKTDKPLLTATPAALATAAHAYATTLNDRDAAVELLTEVRDAFDSGDAARRFDFYSFCAEFYLAHHRYAEATAALETLLSIAPKDDPRRPSWIRSVVIASARSDPTKTLKWASQLPNSAAASSGVAQPMPRQGIEEAGFRRPVAVAASAQQRPARSRPLRRKPAAPEGKPLPPIDPERWVPMKARTYVRDLPPRRQKELRRRRAAEQEEKRRQAERRKREQQQQQPQSPPAAPAAVAA